MKRRENSGGVGVSELGFPPVPGIVPLRAHKITSENFVIFFFIIYRHDCRSNHPRVRRQGQEQAQARQPQAGEEAEDQEAEEDQEVNGPTLSCLTTPATLNAKMQY
jgi:hypothetical protein